MKKDLKKRQKFIEHMLMYNIEILQHFLEESGHPIWSHSFKDLELTPWLFRDKKGLLTRNKKVEVPADLEAAYWKLRFKETLDSYLTIHQGIDQLRAAVHKLGDL